MRRWIQASLCLSVLLMSTVPVHAESGSYFNIWRRWRLRGKTSEAHNSQTDVAFGRQDGFSATGGGLKQPAWEHRYDSRMEHQWNKPAGGNVDFAEPTVADPGDLSKRPFATLTQRQQQEKLRDQLIKTRQRELRAREQRDVHGKRSIFARFRAAWKARWQHRTVDADHQTPFESNGFGVNQRRAISNVGISFHERYDLHKRLARPRQPKPFRPRARPQFRRGFTAPGF